MNEVKWMNWHEWIETNELKRMNWNEWRDINELEWTVWKEWVAETDPNPSVFFVAILMWNRALATVSCTFCRPHLKKWKCQFLMIFMVINCLMTMWSTHETKLSLQSRAHFVDLIFDLIFKKRKNFIFSRFLCEIELSKKCTFCRPYLQKVVRPCHFLFFFVKSSSR